MKIVLLMQGKKNDTYSRGDAFAALLRAYAESVASHYTH